ncbi:MAG: hypothetical protein FWC41_11565 [Firmicutes bacterium]|nr:hypothetical protein [Bacillota bacterium]
MAEMLFLQDKIELKRLEEDYELLLQQFLNYACLEEAFNASLNLKQELSGELSKVKLFLEQYFDGKLPKSTKKSDICDPKVHSFYIYVYKHRKTIVKIRISGHPPSFKDESYKINSQKYSSLYIDYSQIVNKPSHKGVVDTIKNFVNPNKVDYIYLQLNKITLTKTVVQVIMSKVVEYLLKSKLAQASEDKLQFAWAVSEN